MTSELDAVNAILATIGEAPVNSLDVTGLPDVALARQSLTEASRAMQTRGWEFNRETEVPQVRNAAGEIIIPGTALHCDVARSEGRRAAIRGGKLYDLENHTFVWPRDMKLDFIWFMPFEDLPEAAKEYAKIRAGRKFSRAALGSTTIEGFSEADERLAWADLFRAEARQARRNIFNGSVGRDLDRSPSRTPSHLMGGGR